MSTVADRKRFRITGWHVLAAFTAFFAAVLVADTLMVLDAYRTYPGEVTAQPYEEGLRYDAELAQQRRQAALGWQMTAGIARPGVLRVTARDRSGAPLPALRVTGRLARPATEQGARAVTFREAAPGVYEATADVLDGAWDLRLQAVDRRGREFHAERRLVAP